MSSQSRAGNSLTTAPKTNRGRGRPPGKKKEATELHADIEEEEEDRQETKARKGPNKKQKEGANKPLKTPTPKRGQNRELSEAKSVETSESNSEERDQSDPGGNAKSKTKRQAKKQPKTNDSETKDKPRRITKSKTGETTETKGLCEKQNRPEPESSTSESEPTAAFSSALPKSTAKLEAPADNAGSSNIKQKTGAKTQTGETASDVLKATIDKLTIRKSERSKASKCVNTITTVIIKYLKKNLSWCADIERLLTGSYYENVKICEPDEFDVMLTVPVERVEIQSFDEAGAFYSVTMKRHQKHPLDKFLNEDKTIQASDMLDDFREGIKKALGGIKAENYPYEILLPRKRAKCPAVTMEVLEDGKTISLDYVLGLKVHRNSWPECTKGGFKVDKWLGTKVRKNMKQQPFYLVPKYEGTGTSEHDGVAAKDTWRISFSHVEKEILKCHGHAKTCCEVGEKKCCRKVCLKLLKYLLQQLKADDSKSNKMSNFCSYYAKTTLLHACAERYCDTDWAYDQLNDCFQQLLEDFVQHLRDRNLSNFFIPSHNLLNNVAQSSCDYFADKIEFQISNNFPIFS